MVCSPLLVGRLGAWMVSLSSQAARPADPSTPDHHCRALHLWQSCWASAAVSVAACRGLSSHRPSHSALCISSQAAASICMACACDALLVRVVLLQLAAPFTPPTHHADPNMPFPTWHSCWAPATLLGQGMLHPRTKECCWCPAQLLST